MTPSELRSHLDQLFGPVHTAERAAGELRVSTRAVHMWLAGDRAVPGPVAAYLDLADRTRGHPHGFPRARE